MTRGSVTKFAKNIVSTPIFFGWYACAFSKQRERINHFETYVYFCLNVIIVFGNTGPTIDSRAITKASVLLLLENKTKKALTYRRNAKATFRL